MKLIDFCIRYPVSVIVGIILAVLFGKPPTYKPAPEEELELVE